jgi:hypothetical protein
LLTPQSKPIKKTVETHKEKPMLNLLIILLLSSTTTFSLKSMNEQPSKKIGRSESKRTGWYRRNSDKSLSFPSLNEPKTIAFMQQDHPLIAAARSQNHDQIKFYLKNPHLNPNVQNRWYNTALHYSALAKDHVAIMLFINDPRIDVSIKNNDHRTVHDFIDKNEFNGHEMRLKLFARATIDTITKTGCAQMKPLYEQGAMTNDHLIDLIATIKNKILTIEQKQCDNHNDRELPALACLPDYITDEFLTNKIWFLLSLLISDKFKV